jgi:hypothetical protein
VVSSIVVLTLPKRRQSSPLLRLYELHKRAETRGYRVLRDSLTITFADNQPL